ncbi:MAG: DNA-3-methyladenine glycosylase 2 family protein [Gammaproteobacteria bacterium]|nr:DNA-3-methyladenine glycosylase 2 family protein [Gammaproteobacteria bacterium]
MDQDKLITDIDHIAAIDTHVKAALPIVGYPQPRIRPEGFETFLSTIVGQQISTEAAKSIMQRLYLLLPDMQASSLLALSTRELREAGLSGRKVEYAQGLARAIVDGSLDVEALADMDDREAIQSITAIRGFGIWSAEIYLMFSLQRSDIFPANDLALQVAIQRLKGLDARPSEKQARQAIEHWAPWRSAGSLFLWHFYRGAPT